MTMILAALAGFFLLGVVFYLYRFVARTYVTSVNGYFDRENEFWRSMAILIAKTSFGMQSASPA